MLFSRHLIFASLKFRDFFLNREIRKINESRKFHVMIKVIIIWLCHTRTGNYQIHEFD